MTRTHPGGALAAVFAVAAFASTAAAQSYPNKPIRIVVPYAAGGPIDALTRPFAQRLGEQMKSTIIVDNRAGANGAIGYEHVARSAPDGYTIVIGTVGPFAISPKAYGKLPYDPVKDFTPITGMATMPELLVVHPTLPVRNLGELVKLAKARPGQLSYGSSGTGGTPHMAMELLKQAAKIDMTHVPYKGAGPATMDVVAGQLQLMFADLPVLLPQVKAGKLRGLAVGTKTRSPNLPEVPTTAEQGLPAVEAYNWYALFGPANMPREVVARLNGEAVKLLGLPDTKQLLFNLGADASPSTPEALAKLLRDELEKWGEVVRISGVRLD